MDYEDEEKDDDLLEGEFQVRDYGEDLRFSDPLIMKLREVWRQRQDMMFTMSALTLRIRAICRRLCNGDKNAAGELYGAVVAGDAAHPLYNIAFLAVRPLLEARNIIENERKGYEKTVVELAKQLPIAHMVEEISGLGYLGLGAIVGECGDLSKYPNPSGVWKRAGLAVIDGERQRRVRGKKALLHGYSPARRAVFWNITDALFRAQSRGVGKGEPVGPYRALYDRRKEYELSRMKTGEVRSKKHAHARAQRYMCKRLLRDMWEQWVLLSGEKA